MYTLTLTHEERKAIDWVGHRYSNGDDLHRMLWNRSEAIASMSAQEGVVTFSQEVEWDDKTEITFKIPEHVAWNIKNNAEQEDGYWPCFAKDLADKMQQFIDNIV